MFAILSSFLSGKNHGSRPAAAPRERRFDDDAFEAADCSAAYRDGVRMRLDEAPESRFEAGARGS